MRSEIEAKTASGRKTKSVARGVNAHRLTCGNAAWSVSYRGPIGVKDLVDGGREIPDTRARDDDRVPSAVCFLRDPEESSAIVFTKLHVETLPFDLEFFRLDDAVHFRKRRSLGQSAYRMEANSATPVAAVYDRRFRPGRRPVSLDLPSR